MQNAKTIRQYSTLIRLNDLVSLLNSTIVSSGTWTQVAWFNSFLLTRLEAKSLNVHTQLSLYNYVQRKITMTLLPSQMK